MSAIEVPIGDTNAANHDDGITGTLVYHDDGPYSLAMSEHPMPSMLFNSLESQEDLFMGREKTLGKIVVTSAGTPVQASATDVWCENYMVEPWHTNTGRMWIGNSASMSKTTGAYVRGYLPIPHDNVVTAYSPGKGTHGIMSYNLKDLWIDSEVNGESVIIPYNA